MKNRFCIESGLQQILPELNKIVQELFISEFHDFEVKIADEVVKKSLPLVKCKEISAFVQLLLDLKECNPHDQIVKIGLDGGGGFLKATLNIVSKEQIEPEEKKGNYGKEVQKTFKPGSVQCSFLVAIVPQVKETNYNVDLIVNSLNLNEIDHVIVADLKLCQVAAGISESANSIHPCYVCTWDRTKPFSPGEIRTIESQRESYEAFKGSGSNKKDVRHYDNCLNPSVLSGEGSEKLIDKLVPPELHLMEGAVNHLYTKMKENTKNPAGIENIITGLHIQQGV